MKKLSVSAKILYLLDTKGGFKPKDIIKETKLKPASVYTALNTLRNQKKVAKEEDGVYIIQTRTSTTPAKVLTPVNKKLTDTIKRLETDLSEMQRVAMYWKQAYHELEVKSRGNVAVIQYLESKIEQLFK
jgi:DNA-binding IclR family transcriptional regulator